MHFVHIFKTCWAVRRVTGYLQYWLFVTAGRGTQVLVSPHENHGLGSISKDSLMTWYRYYWHEHVLKWGTWTFCQLCGPPKRASHCLCACCLVDFRFKHKSPLWGWLMAIPWCVTYIRSKPAQKGLNWPQTASIRPEVGKNWASKGPKLRQTASNRPGLAQKGPKWHKTASNRPQMSPKPAHKGLK